VQRLGKNPEEYPKSDGQPHVHVALKMKAKGGNARGGDVIPYIFCLEDGQESAKSGQADRAHHPDELRRGDNNLRIGKSYVKNNCAYAHNSSLDYEFYLSQQILPPIDRLCDPIEGTDRPRLAECLGLDPSKYKSTAASGPDERAFATLDSQISDEERFKNADHFTVKCRHCGSKSEFTPISDREVRPLG
jgi:DNA polymerase alpha subunit A